jgi:hypothetical protein
MRYTYIIVTGVFFITVCPWLLLAQINEWPSELGAPVPLSAPDSNGIEYNSSQGLFTRTFKARDSVSIKKSTPYYGVNQTVDFELDNDSWFSTKNQYFDLSGEALKKALLPGISMGLEWTPVLLLKTQRSTQGVLGSVEAGPVIKAQPFGVPIKMHGGASVRGTNENVGAIALNKYGTLSKDKGYYAGVEFGEPSQPLPFLPLHLNFKGYGRSMGASRLITGTGSALFYYKVSSGDSVFALYADSLTNGRDAFLGQAQGKPHFIDDPEKSERSNQFQAGIKGKSRYFLQPGFIYSFAERDLFYKGMAGNRKTSENAVNVLCKTDTLFPVSYSGGIRIGWEREEKNSFYSYDTNGSMTSRTAGTNQSISLYDYTAYRIAMLNSVAKYLPNGIGVSYIFDMSRYSEDYPNYYISNKRIVRSGLDKDIINNRHKITLVPIPSSWGKSSLYFEYSKNTVNFIKKEMSGNSTIDNFYRLGGEGDFVVFEKCSLSEAMSLDAKVRRYAFPETKIGKPPSYSRKWSSSTFFDVAATGWLTFKTEWQETYWDYGTWNGKEYIDTTTLPSSEEAAAYQEYYAIIDKAWEHGVKVSAAIRLFDGCIVNAGCSYLYRDIRNYDVVLKQYTPRSNAGHLVSPFASAFYQAGPQLVFQADFKRTFDVIDKFWDIHVSLNGVF